MTSSLIQAPTEKTPPGFLPPEYRTGNKGRWHLDVLHDVPSKLKDLMRIHLDAEATDFEQKIRHASYLFIHEAVAEIEGQKDDKSSWEWHHRIYYDWMKSIIEQGEAGKLAKGSQRWSQTSLEEKKRLLSELEAGNAAGMLSCRVGKKLTSIIRGEIAPLELMMQGDLLHDYYQDHPRMKVRAYNHLHQITELYAMKLPGANVLEIGAGTGGATAIVLEAFEAEDESGDFESLLGHFDFTDISFGFFKAARQKFIPWTTLIDYKKLDIRTDPIEQSFLAGSYDLIVASAVLHATPSLNETLTNVRKLLKPGGKLLMVEFTQDSLDTQLIFGTLPGWWLGEESYRKTSPNIPIEIWDKVLKDTGFTGVDLDMRDCEQFEFQSLSIIMATAIDPQPSYPSSITIVSNSSSIPEACLNRLRETVQARLGPCHVSAETLQDLHIKNDTVIILAPETMAELDEVNSAASEKLKRVSADSRGILQLSCNSIIDTEEPYGQAQGQFQPNDPNTRYIKLDFESSQSDFWSQEQVSHIAYVLQQSFNKNINPSEIAREYAVRDSILYVSGTSPANFFQQC